jgi:hypothetical protein
LDILDDLSVNQAGLLFKAIKAYQNDEEIEVDEIVKLVFSPFKNQFKRDDEKYTKTCERRAIAGSKGGKQKVANASKCKQELANVADKKNKNKNKNKTKNDNDSDNKSDSKKEVTVDRFDEFWGLYDKKTGLPKCKAKFSKLADSDIELIFKNLPAYVASTPDKKFRKNPEVWINNQCWHDEIIKESFGAKSTHSFETQNYTSGKF